MLDCIAYLVGSCFVLAVGPLQEDPDGWRLDSLGHVDDLLEPWDTQRHVSCSHSSQMEGVEGHLCGGLTHALGTDAAGHLARVSKAALKSGLDRSEQPVKGLFGESLSLDDVFGAEKGPQIDLEQPSRVAVCVDKQPTFCKPWSLVDPDSFLKQAPGGLDDVVRTEICLGSWLDSKHLLRGPEQAWHVDWQMQRVVTAAEDLATQRLSVLLELRVLSLEVSTEPLEVSNTVDHVISHALSEPGPSLGNVSARSKELEALCHRLVVHLDQRNRDVLNVLCCHTVLAIEELDDLVS